ncbi:MAG: hypothetical protein JST27_03515 [Bacteroidetes bacterium]|nr:hypothetical protein [Bacteroidota bacterium]
MKTFLMRCVCFLALALATLWLLTAFTDSRLHNRDKGRFKVWNEIANGKINADLLIMGSSHAHVQVNPKLLQPLFPGGNIFNAGMDGYTFPVQLARYHFYRRHNKKPRCILLCVDYLEFGNSEFKIDRIQFLPYTYDTSIRNALSIMGVSWPRVYLPFLKYRGESQALIAGISPTLSLAGDQDFSQSNGFMPVNSHWSETAFQQDTTRETHQILFEPRFWLSFEELRRQCLQEHIQLITVFTPHHSRFVQKIPGATAYRNWLRSQLEPQTPFIDFSNAAFCADTSLFYNPSHLNEKGANTFSLALADSLRNRGINEATSSAH